MKVGNIEIDFKPEFGNTRHIRVCELVSKAEGHYASYKKAMADARLAKSAKKKYESALGELEKEIGYLKKLK